MSLWNHYMREIFHCIRRLPGYRASLWQVPCEPNWEQTRAVFVDSFLSHLHTYFITSRQSEKEYDPLACVINQYLMKNFCWWWIFFVFSYLEGLLVRDSRKNYKQNCYGIVPACSNIGLVLMFFIIILSSFLESIEA